MATRFFLFVFAALLAVVAPGRASEAVQPAFVVADGESGEILDSFQPVQPRHPASLAKLMTLYIAFQSVAEGRARWETVIPVSVRAARQGGSVLGLEAGERLTVEQAVQAVITRSANDAAVALAEYLGGSEAGFAERMNQVARQLGMNSSHFLNATGLSASGQMTTASDMSRLALALRLHFPKDYPLFAQRHMRWKKQVLPNLNGFLGVFQGAEGMKTGFTCPAGYNLVAAANRGGKRVIGVVLGARSRDERESLMAQYLGRAFRGILPKASAATVEPARAATAAMPDLSATVCAGGFVPGEPSTSVYVPSGWGMELSFGRSPAKVRQELADKQKLLGLGGHGSVTRAPFSGDVRYRGMVTGLGEEQAVRTCLSYRAKGGDCLVLNPQVVRGSYEEQQRLARFSARD